VEYVDFKKKGEQWTAVALGFARKVHRPYQVICGTDNGNVIESVDLSCFWAVRSDMQPVSTELCAQWLSKCLEEQRSKKGLRVVHGLNVFFF